MHIGTSTAFRWGLIFGGIMTLLVGGLAGVSILLVSGLDSQDFVGSPETAMGLLLVVTLAGCLVFLVYLALFLLAGMFAARQTGGIGTGTIAGLIAGSTGGLFGGIITAVLTILFPVSVSGATSGSIYSSDQANLQLASAIVGAVFRLILYAGLGAGVGALGALIGRGQYRAQHPEAAFTFAMYPAYPGMPPMGVPAPGPYPAYPGTYPPPPGAYPPPPYAPYPPADQAPPSGGYPAGENFAPPPQQ